MAHLLGERRHARGGTVRRSARARRGRAREAAHVFQRLAARAAGDDPGRHVLVHECGGLAIEAFVMRPYGYRSGKSYPLILYIHGGPHWNYGNVFFPEMQLLAGQGYWVLLVNPRGSSGYGHDFTFATRGRWGMEDYQDLMKAVDVAIARGGVDTTRLGVAGGSYGGFMTNWVVGQTHRFAAAETDRSIYDWYSWYGSSDA